MTATTPTRAPLDESEPEIPPAAQWPKGMKRLVLMRALWSAVAPLRTNGEDACWEHLLRAVFRGRQFEQTLLSRSATTAECFAVALRELERYEAAGSPTELVPETYQPRV